MTAATSGASLANQTLSQTPATRVVGQVGLAIAGSLLLTLAAKTQVPFWPVPMTLQTLAIFAIAAAYGRNLAVATLLLYLAQGFAGLPVFAGPIAGPAYFAGPTAGFLIGFVIAAGMIGAAADRGWSRQPLRLFGAMIAADIVLFAIGFAWLAFGFVSASTGSTLGASVAWASGVAPFLLADLVKMALVALAVPLAWKLVAPRA